MSDTASRLLNMAAEKFSKDPKELTPEADMFDALGINSIQALELLTDLENTFDIEIPDYEVADVRTFGDLIEVIERRK